MCVSLISPKIVEYIRSLYPLRKLRLRQCGRIARRINNTTFVRYLEIVRYYGELSKGEGKRGRREREIHLSEILVPFDISERSPSDIPAIPHLDLESSVQSRSGSIVARSMSLRDAESKEFTVIDRSIDRSRVAQNLGQHLSAHACAHANSLADGLVYFHFHHLGDDDASTIARFAICDARNNRRSLARDGTGARGEGGW